MATTFSLYRPNLVLAPFPVRTATPDPLLFLPRTNDYFYHNSLSRHKKSLRGSLAVARLGFNSGFFPDPDSVESLVGELFGRAESVLYTIADAAVSNSDTVTSTTKQSNDWLSGITFYMESVLKVLKDGLSAVHVPYAYGFAIILLTVLVKAATFPLSKKQVESAMSMRALQPQVKAIQERYAGNQEKIQVETARIYKLAGINPLAGCLPTLATIPVWIGLYRALSNVADEGLLSEGFFWIPSLAGPTTIASRQNGSGISWLFPFVSNDPSMKSSQTITKLLPIMIGYFALSVPSGLSLYWFTNNILSTAQQVWLQKLGGAKISVRTTPEDIPKEDQVQIQKSVSELITTKKVARQGEKLTSDGLLPGERFKQIKEQEARRRQQREEKEKAGETVAKGTQLTNEGHEREARLLESENGAGSESVDENNPSNFGVVNGDLTGKDSEEDKIKSPVLRVEEDKVSANSKEAVEVHTTTTTKDIKLPGEDIHQTRQE
ncbi:hypothetical protein I3760_05G172000 [Carya illinoinensis]|nr:hypothetical protein I3760_05G172000 [Carya illinoinensis]